MDLIEKVSSIQSKLKANKSQFNKFGNYAYRSCEDILEAVKPILNGLILTLSDEVVAVGDRIYIKATANISDGKNHVEATAFAREPLSQKGMSEPQCTGSASSYARKYALNGLFCIDDNKDADTNESKQQADNTPNYYNDFEKQKDLMLKKIQSGEQTSAGIIAALKKTGLVLSQKVIKQIEDLEK